MEASVQPESAANESRRHATLYRGRRANQGVQVSTGRLVVYAARLAAAYGMLEVSIWLAATEFLGPHAKGL